MGKTDVSNHLRRTSLLIGIVALVAASCGDDNSESEPTTGGSQTTTGGTDGGEPAPLDQGLRIGVGIDAAYAPFFVAEAEGLFADEGLEDVELVQFARGGEAVDALGAGEVDLAGNSDTTTLTSMAANPEIRALLVYQESGEYLKLVTSAEIEEFSEIKTMGIVPGLSEYNAEVFVEDQGLSDVEYVTAAPAEIPALLQRGDIDAYILWEPWPTQGVGLGGKVMGNTGDFGSAYVHWLVATDEWLNADDNGEYAEAVSRALTKASEFVESDPERTAEITEEAVTVPPEQTIEAIEQIDFAVRGFDDDDFASYEQQIEYLESREMIASAPDLETAIDVDFYTAVTEGN